jgi:two-component system chemotaxis response regulator CheB
MTGALNDGTAGLQAIKACGGRAVVQDPDDAFEPSMPASARAWVEVDAVARLDALPGVLARLARGARSRADVAVDERVAHEQQWFTGKGNVMEHMQNVASPSTYVCLDCKGALWEITDSRPARYRCHTGHGFTLRTLYDTQFAQTDEALWGAVRALQEQELLLDRLLDESASMGIRPRPTRIARGVRISANASRCCSVWWPRRSGRSNRSAEQSVGRTAQRSTSQ